MTSTRPASGPDEEALATTAQPAAEWLSFDLLATLVAVVDEEGRCLFANSSFEDIVGVSRRTLMRGSLLDWMVDADALKESLAAVARNDFATRRFDAQLRRPPGISPARLPVHVIVNQTERRGCILVQLVEIQQQTRQDREERALDQAQATKELIRNLAHEIKNPLGGIRGSAQLLAMELEGREDLSDYTRVIISEADRLQLLVDRLLAPHRRPHVVGDVNIHEVLERVRRLVLAEFPKGLTVVRDYDASLPEFKGDLEQLIQAMLNIVRNAAQALSERMAAGDAVITLRSRAARQVTIGKQRFRLALELHVIDNGPGISPDIRDRIFFPLVSGREGGSGLGLPMAQTFVQQHQGMIDCQSSPGRTQFRILIPLP